MCKVSVVIPIYNAEAYLEETLHSVGSQTLHDIEIVCVDDGSTDHSADIIKKALVSDSRIRYLYQSNQGAGMARNKGIKAAVGEYIAFMDADDCYPNESVLETLYTATEQNKAFVCGGSAKRTDTDEPWGEDRNFSAEGFIKFSDYQFDFLFVRFLFKRSFLIENDIQFPALRVYEDPLFLINALIKAEKFYAIKDTVYLYNGSHQSQSMSSEKVEDYLKGLTAELEISSRYKLPKLHKLAFDRLEKEGCYYAEQYLYSENKKILCLLLNANSAVDKELIGIDDDYILPAIVSLWRAGSNYIKIRNFKPIQPLLRMMKK